MKLHNYFSHGDGVKITEESDSDGTFCCNKCKYTGANETQYRYHLMLGEHKTELGNSIKKTCNKCEINTNYGGAPYPHYGGLVVL